MKLSTQKNKDRINSQLKNKFMAYCTFIGLIISTGIFNPIWHSQYAIPFFILLISGFRFFLNNEQFRVCRKDINIFLAKRLYISKKYHQHISVLGFIIGLIIFGLFLILAFTVWIEQYYAPIEAWKAYSKIGFLVGVGIYMAFWIRFIFNMRPTFDERILKLLGRKP